MISSKEDLPFTAQQTRPTATFFDKAETQIKPYHYSFKRYWFPSTSAKRINWRQHPLCRSLPLNATRDISLMTLIQLGLVASLIVFLSFFMSITEALRIGWICLGAGFVLVCLIYLFIRQRLSRSYYRGWRAHKPAQAFMLFKRGNKHKMNYSGNNYTLTSIPQQVVGEGLGNKTEPTPSDKQLEARAQAASQDC